MIWKMMLTPIPQAKMGHTAPSHVPTPPFTCQNGAPKVGKGARTSGHQVLAMAMVTQAMRLETR